LTVDEQGGRVSAPTREIGFRTGRVRTSARLGEYVEFGEPWRRSLLVIGLWLAGAALCVEWATTTQFSTDCYRGVCGAQAAEANKQAVVWMAVVCFVGSALFIWRRLLRHPGLRVGQGGFEIRTQVLARHKFVRWQDVRVLYPSRRYMRIWRGMNVGLVHAAVAQGAPSFVTVRLSGLSAPPSEIEAEMAERVRQAHPKRPHLVDRRTVSNGQRTLLGITVATGDDQTYTDITSARLMDLLEGLGPDSQFLILTAPSSRDDQHYIQVCQAGAGGWHVEYRDGGPDSHYGLECDDLEKVHQVLLAWADDSPDWRTRLPWYPMEIHETEALALRASDTTPARTPEVGPMPPFAPTTVIAHTGVGRFFPRLRILMSDSGIKAPTHPFYAWREIASIEVDPERGHLLRLWTYVGGNPRDGVNGIPILVNLNGYRMRPRDLAAAIKREFDLYSAR
jgi:hypothetical protein